MSEHHHHRHKSRKSSHQKSLHGKNFVILPIVFCILTYLMIAAVTIPAASSYWTIINMFFSDKERSVLPEHTNIFVPVEEHSQTSTESEPKPKPETVSASSFTFPSYEDQFGELIIEDCQIHADLFFGDSWYVLGNGVGIYNGSAIPGYGRTILIAGHNNTYFNGLKHAKKGQIVKIRTNYGNYQYEITGTRITDNEDRSAYDLNAEEENLILYTCYPYDTLGLTNLRAFTYAKYVSGPMIDKNS